MLDLLRNVVDTGGRLVNARHALFEGDPQFITAVELQFESLSVVLCAVPDDDTLAVNSGEFESTPDEILVEVSDSNPWSKCLGSGLAWAWELTNQQGYSDGLRLEFEEPGEPSNLVVELIVIASAIELFVATAAR